MMRVTNRSAEEPSTMSTLRRMQTLNRILSSPKNMNRMSRETIKLNYTCSIFCRHKSTVESGIVTIGNVKKLIRDPSRPEYVPVQYLDKQPSQKILSDLKWMLQKDNLGQDIFLIGRPGRSRRILALMYSELTQKEVEFVSLSRDTTEADLKQRREIVGGSAQYLNQSAVRAAVEGRILILEGIEKAERNVLPVLNNLLENREMHLEDGRFLMAPKSYDKLIKDHGEEYLAKSNLIRVHEEFRVIALGLAVPNYIGNPLDPPLRSRFQARDVDIVPYKEMESLLFDANPSIDAVKLKQILSCGYALLSTESKSIELPDFPIDNLVLAAKILNLDPSTEIGVLFRMLYPYTIIAGKDGQSAVSSILQSFKVTESPSNAYPEIQTTNKNNLDSNKCLIRTSDHITLELKTGNSNVEKESRFVPLPYHNHVLINLLRAHAADSDFCIVGPSGCGKTEIVKRFSELLDYDVVPIVLYQDITSRDLIQRRDTTENGDTVWKYSPLISAALEGKIALLDGVHRVHASTLSILHRLMVDREIQLHDGQRLIRHDRYDYLAAKYGVERLTSSNIHRIHPSFRIIAMAEPPGGYNSQWLTSEMLTFFPINDMRSLNHLEEIQLIEALTGQVDSRMKVVLNVVNKLRSSKDAAIASAASSLTTRMLIRIAKRLSYFPNHDVYEIVQQACLAKFLPPLTRKALNTILHKSGIHPTSAESSSSMTSYSVDDEKLTIGDTVIPRYRPTQASSHKIPDVLFYDSPQHINLLKNLLQDFTIGEHLLLVGNQGVGKNKLTDRMLQLLNRPREYIQLHRDTTVQSLTVQPTVVDGCVKYEDSPLVRAVREGNVLVIDEADKAPIHVTCILGTLVEAGEMILSDGRMIVPSWNQSTESNVIKMHPDFRIILISNRPGFPFLGNNLFGVLGDLFSCHVIDNPRPESEIQLLRQYGPNVDDDTLKRVLRLFQDLRELADNGLLLYPYSTREAVNVVKHLQAYPTDGLAEAVSNVFDFDRYSVDMKSILVRVLHEHEIPIELVGAKQRTGDEHLQLTIERESGLDVSGPKHGKIDETGNPHVGGNTWAVSSVAYSTTEKSGLCSLGLKTFQKNNCDIFHPAGGTGGRDTAGLGGKGGPYRLDAGHNVHQLSDEEKNAIPEHVKKAAREMGIKAFKNRLKEIQMSEYDAKVYNEYSLPVQNQVQALRIVLSSLQARTKERQWMRHQTTGELDDTKLVEGVTGERAIYRRRADVEPELGAPQIKPKRLKLVVDVSGSMYRFNGFDGRLDREMEAVIMVMEAFQGFENKIQYDIVGHSGESDCINFVNKNNPPIDNKQRLDVIKTMHAHAQFCISGDYTLEAIQNAIRSLEKEQNEFDEGIIIALSDANLSRYGISPYRLSDTLQLSDIVGAYAIFIGSLGDQAVRLTNALPAGRGFVCMNLENIPQIIQQIFAASLFKS